jgi:hypothetical protein
MDVDVTDHMRFAMRREQAVDQGLQTVGLGDDDLRVLLQFGRRQFGVKQLRCAAYAT